MTERVEFGVSKAPMSVSVLVDSKAGSPAPTQGQPSVSAAAFFARPALNPTEASVQEAVVDTFDADQVAVDTVSTPRAMTGGEKNSGPIGSNFSLQAKVVPPVGAGAELTDGQYRSSAENPTESRATESRAVADKFISTLLGVSSDTSTSTLDAVGSSKLTIQEGRSLVSAPHQARWDSSAVQVELVKLVKEGGGQVIMKLTPPDEGAFRINLTVDADSSVRISVEGASDSVRTRLEQGAEQLREQFSLMGMNLQLDLSGRRDSSSQQEAGGSAFAMSDDAASAESDGVEQGFEAAGIAVLRSDRLWRDDPNYVFLKA
jgi:hypothetical protein